MTYTLFAQWFGIISVILSLGILFNLDEAKKLAHHMVKEESGYIMGGVLPLIFGTLSFLLHHDFSLGWPLAMSLIGLMMMLMGAFRVLFVCTWRKVMVRHIDQIPSLFSLFGLIFGLLMLYVGFLAPLVAYKFAS